MIEIIILLLLLVLSAFFSASEVAFLSLTDAKVETMVSKKLPRADIVKKLKKNNRRLLVTILIGNNIVNIAASSIATVVVTKWTSSGVVGITTGVMTLLVLIFGEIIPKSYATNHPKRFAIMSATYLHTFGWLITPIVTAFEWITNKTAGAQEVQRISEEEILALAKTSRHQGSIEHGEGEMIERLFAFNDITAEDIMTPRVHVTFIEDTHTINQATETIKENPFTRFPVFHDTFDSVIGYVHSRDVLLAYHNEQDDQPLQNIVRKIIYVPKQLPIDDVMKEFQKHQTHMAVVVDEFGGTLGIVTFEDVIEELVGEIADEHDLDDDLIQRVNKETVRVAGHCDVRDVNDFLNVEIPGDEFDTISEVMMDALQRIPRKGLKVTLGNTECMVLEVKKRTIQKVQIKKIS